MSKIAICISGAPREFKSCYPYFKKNVLNQLNNPDIFISTWHHQIPQYKNYCQTEGTPEELVELYKPTIYNIGTYNQETQDFLANWCGLIEFQKSTKCPCKQENLKCEKCGSKIAHNQLAMFYQILWANNLKKEYEINHRFKYDYVIRSRCDNLFLEPIKKVPFDQLNDNNIWIPSGIDNVCSYGSGPNDQLAIGTSKVMDIYANTFYKLNKHMVENYQETGGWGLPHRALKRQFNDYNIDVIRSSLKNCVYYKRTKFYGIK